MDYACPSGGPPVAPISRHCRCFNPSNFAMLPLRLGTVQYNGNRQIHEELGVSFFADHIRSLTERFDSKLADVGVTWV